jgi:serine/threonine-protein kinase
MLRVGGSHVVVDEAEKESLAALTKVSDLGRYRLIAELARGGMGIVYLALVRGPGGFNKLFVVKELKSHLVEDVSLVRMFTEEARLAAKLNHPNVVQTIEVGAEGTRHFIAMEYLDGQSLNRVLLRARKAGKPFPLHFFLHVLAHALEGLQYAHSLVDFDGTPLGLVHRDVSPHNIFVTYDGQVKVLDFGIAKALDSSNDTRTGILKGKVSYMAPEQAAGQPVDRRSDLFSCGVMLFEAATGVRMWKKAANDLQILHALMHGNVPRPRDVTQEIDPAIERIILKATAVKKEDRYASASEMQADVEQHLKTMDVPAFSARDVGKFFSDVFQAERDRIKKVIDAQLRTLRGMGSGEYGKVDMPRLSGMPGPNTTPSGVHYANSGSNPSFDGPASARENPTLDESMLRSDPSLRAHLTSGSSAVVAAVQPTPLPAPPAKSRAPMIGAIAIVAALVAGGAVYLRRAPPPVAAPAAPAAPAPAANADPIKVLVTASPRDAMVKIDDRPSQRGTFTGTFPRDSASHAIRIEAPKFQTKMLSFSADDDHTFDVSLEPTHDAPVPAAAAGPAAGPVWHPSPGGHRPSAPPPAAAPTAAPAAPAPPPPSPPPAATSTGRSRQQIDTRDPYAQ